MPGLTIGVLGQLEVSVDGRVVRLTTGRLRALLAVLAVTAGRAVSMERLTAAVWADEPPANPRRSLQTYASRLRSELGDRVTTQAAGLALDAGVDEVDALRFEHILADAAGRDRPEDERRLLDEALGLWRGEPFEGITSPWLDEVEAPRLTERRLTALERRIDLDLAAGRHGDLIGELNTWTMRCPMRESLWVRLLIALDRSGRRADALERYEQVRRSVADQLGVDPSPELRQVYADLLSDHPVVTGPARPEGRTTPVALPQQLPASPPAFTGRAAELAQLDTVRDSSAVVITAIDGMAGVGKTALAVHAARQLAGRYSDGQLFLDLHGFTEGVTPVDPSDALDRMLRSLGVPGEQIPPQLDDRAALYRSRLADRRMLILLDNAVTEAQVIPLLPGSPGCLVLITSRRRLAGLDQTRAVSLDVLPPNDAVDLFVNTVGADRLSGVARESLREIVELCGRLPLALRIAAARLRAHPTWTVRHLIDRLHDRQQRLVELEAGQRSVTAALDMSYHQLSTDQQRAYRLIGLHPGSNLDLYAAAALFDGDLPETRRMLDQLLDAHLVQEPTPDRYEFHDLARNHAVLVATRDESEAGRDAVLHRLLTHYTHTAAAAMDAAYPFEQERRPQPPPSRHPIPDVRTPDLAMAWLDAELHNLLAAATYSVAHGWPAFPIRLAGTLDRHLTSRSRTSDAEALHQCALNAARASGDAVAEVKALVCLGQLHRRTGQHPQAEANYLPAVQLAREHDHPHGEMDALNGLGQIRRLRGQFTEATGAFERALDLAGTIDYPTGELQALLGLGHLNRELSQHELATRYLRRGLDLARATGNTVGQMGALIGLGWSHRLQDHHEEAAQAFSQALDIAHAGGHRTGELTSLLGLGDVHRRQGRFEAAAGFYDDVLARARKIGKPNWTFEALQALGRTRLGQHQPDDALAYHHEALDIAVQIDQPVDVARANDGIAHAYRARKDHDQARRHWQCALDILTELGIENTEDWEASATAIRSHLAADEA